jgi:hypothetical protein
LLRVDPAQIGKGDVQSGARKFNGSGCVHLGPNGKRFSAGVCQKGRHRQKQGKPDPENRDKDITLGRTAAA